MYNDDFADRIPEVLKTLNEREQCIIEKRMAGITFKKTGEGIINLGAHRDPCDGITITRVQQIYAKALRKLRAPSRMRVWTGEMSGREWLEKYIKD